MPRMKIFSSLEREAFESPPLFDSAERKRFLTLSSSLDSTLANLRTPTNKVCFLVAAGYFKARRKFFARQFRQTDIDYVARQLDVFSGEVRVEDYSKETYTRHQRAILDYFGCGPFDEAAKVFIVGELAALVRVQFRPKAVLLEIIQILIRKKIVIPSYSKMRPFRLLRWSREVSHRGRQRTLGGR